MKKVNTMETNVRFTIVGAFVIVLFSFMTFGVIWLSAGFSIETYNTYKVYMKESVSGLTVDAAVEFNGVNVGTVKTIKISDKDPKLVELLLRIRSSTPISEGTTATMNMRGLTGVTFIALRDTGDNKTLLRPRPGETYAVIKTSPSLLMRFDQALTELNQSIHTVSDSIQKLLNDDNLYSIQAILKNLKQVTEELSPLLQNSAETMQIINRHILPAANQTINRVDGMTGQMGSIVTEIKQNPSIVIRGKTPEPLGPGEK